MFTAMFPGFTWILGLKWAVIVGSLTALLFTANSYVKEYERRGISEVNLKSDLKKSEALRLTADAQRRTDLTAIAVLNDRLAMLPKSLEENCALFNKIQKSTDPSADQPLGGVIGETLEELERRENSGVRVIRP